MRNTQWPRPLCIALLSLGLALGWATGCRDSATNDNTDSGNEPPLDASAVDSSPPAPEDAGLDAEFVPDSEADVSQDAPFDGADAANEDTSDHDADDASEPDAVTEPPDSSIELPLPGFGSIVACPENDAPICAVLGSALTAEQHYYFENHLDFGIDPFDVGIDNELLTVGAQYMLNTENAGGSSDVSEAFAFEMLARCQLAELLSTEMEIQYNPKADGGVSKKTDILVSIDSVKIGVSVVRAMTYNAASKPYKDRVLSEIEGKLKDILVSSANVKEEFKWHKQILYVFAEDQEHADLVYETWQGISSANRADTIVMVTVSDGADGPIYNR